MKCPYCNKLTSELVKKCVHCGEDLSESIGRDNDAPVKCPLCTVNTEIINLAGVELDYCYKCGGIWFDKGEINQFRDGVVNQDICKDMITTLGEMSLINQDTKRVDYLKCPVCNQVMSQRNFVDISSIIIERCADHGTWAEQDDLLKILKVVESGKYEGLLEKAEYKKKQELEKRLKKIEGNQSHLDRELTRVSKFQKIHFILDFFGFT
jgi:Zn-finger nucleic acid-binding protein